MNTIKIEYEGTSRIVNVGRIPLAGEILQTEEPVMWYVKRVTIITNPGYEQPQAIVLLMGLTE